MGKSVLKSLKYRSEVLLKEFPDSLGASHEKNKKFLDTMELGLSKSSRNIVAGYITRLVAKKEKQ
ncbi:MAG: 30S ribosomal protein S17e [archaeon]|jgi:ribosomal protein S17E